MFFVDFEPRRDEHRGQFFVRLVQGPGSPDYNADWSTGKYQVQYGYWCDRRHLEAIKRTVDHALGIPQSKAAELELSYSDLHAIIRRGFEKYWWLGLAAGGQLAAAALNALNEAGLISWQCSPRRPSTTEGARNG